MTQRDKVKIEQQIELTKVFLLIQKVSERSSAEGSLASGAI